MLPPTPTPIYWARTWMYLLMCLLGQVKQSVPVSGLIADEATWAHLIFST